MTLYSSREGRLCVDGKRVPLQITRSSFPADSFATGDFSIAANKENILVICQCFLDLYVIPMGGKKLPSGFGYNYTSQDLELKYQIYKKNPNLIDGDLRMRIYYSILFANGFAVVEISPEDGVYCLVQRFIDSLESLIYTNQFVLLMLMTIIGGYRVKMAML